MRCGYSFGIVRMLLGDKGEKRQCAMCRFRRQGDIRLDGGVTREQQKRHDNTPGEKRSHIFCPKKIKSRQRTKERRHQRAFKKMPEPAQERILRQRQERRARICFFFVQTYLRKEPM